MKRIGCLYSGSICVVDYTENKGHNGEFHFSMIPYIGCIYGKMEDSCNFINNSSTGIINIDKLQSDINWWNWGFHHHDQTVNVH